MTKEDAIKRLKRFREYNEEDFCGGDRIEVDGDWYYYMDARDFEAFDMAIKALERKSCDDFISRKDANDILRNALYDNAENAKTYRALGEAKMKILNLPAVQPNVTEENYRKVCEALTAITGMEDDTHGFDNACDIAYNYLNPIQEGKE